MWQWQRNQLNEREVDPHERALSEDVAALALWFRAVRSRPGPRLSWGYGTAWGKLGREFPLLVLSRNSVRGWNQKYRSPVLDAESSFSPAEAYLVSEELAALELPRTSLPLFVAVSSRPTMSAASTFDKLLLRHLPVGGSLVCGLTGSSGTPGVAVQAMNHTVGVLTAGHVFPRGVGSPVECVTRRMWWSARRKFGTVLFHCSPTGGRQTSPHMSGWDAAIVLPHHAPKQNFIGYKLHEVRSETTIEPVFARCSTSGIVSSASVLQARLEEMDAGNFYWRCVWILFPSGVMTSGDSGAAVFLQKDGALLGTYVGRSTFDNVTHAHYVQDAQSLQHHVLRRWGVRFFDGGLTA